MQLVVLANGYTGKRTRINLEHGEEGLPASLLIKSFSIIMWTNTILGSFQLLC